MAGLKFNEKDVISVLLDKPIVGMDSRYDFTEWILNSEQPSDGVTIKQNEIVITKFKPNVPIVTSNFSGTGTGNTPTSSEICAVSNLIEARLSGFEANTNLFTQFQYNIPIECTDGETRYIGHVNPYYSIPKFCGLYFAPFYCVDNVAMPFSVFLATNNGRDGTIKYANQTTGNLGDDGYLRGTNDGDNLGFGTFYHRHDVKSTLTPDWVGLPSNIYRIANQPISQGWDGSWNSWTDGPNAYWQLAIILFTNYAPDANGIITLNSPITIHMENLCPVDPTTIEGYRVALKDELVYEKERTFENTLGAHGLAFSENTYYERKVNGGYPKIGVSPNNNADVIGGRIFNSKASFVMSGGSSALLNVYDFNYLENLKWYPGDITLANNVSVTIYGRILGMPSSSTDPAAMVAGSGRIYALGNATSISGDDIPAPGAAGTAGTLAEPYTVAAAVARAKQLGVDQNEKGIPDPNYSYITGTVSSILSNFAPPYEEYDRLRLPVPTDLEELIFTNNAKVKFWIEQYDRPLYKDFWYTVADIFERNEIVDPYYTNHLFTHSGGNLSSLSLNIDVSNSNIINMSSIFEESTLPLSLTITIESGVLFSLVNAFRLTSKFNSVIFTNVCETISDWNGSFEGTGLVNFPTNLYPMDRRHDDSEPIAEQLSGPTCYISDCADNSSLTYFGNWISTPGQGGLTPVATLTPAVIGTSNNVGSVTLDRQTTSSDKVTIRANVCPGVSIPSWDAQTYQIRRMEPFYGDGSTTNDGIVFLLQGIGYDANNNKVGASPTYVCSRCSTNSAFDASVLFAAANYTPDSLNTNTVNVHFSDHVSTGFQDTYYYREVVDWQQHAFEPDYIEMEMTAFGLQRMQINMYVFNVTDTISGNSYSVSYYDPVAHMWPDDTVSSYNVTSWGISGSAVAMLEQGHMTVNPYCKNAFNSAALQEIRYILDMKYVTPLRDMITDGNSFAVFNAPNLTTAYIQNLNKGHWNFDPTNNTTDVCAGNLGSMSAECANYLLNNLFDLRRNDPTSEYSMVDRIENDLNSFRGWTVSGTGWRNVVAFSANGNATLIKTITTNGKLKLNVSLNGCTAEVKRSSVTVATLVSGYNEVNVYSGDTVTILVAISSGVQSMEASILLAEPFMSELTEDLLESSIYLPESWGQIVTQAALDEARDRQWNVYINGVLVNGRIA